MKSLKFSLLAGIAAISFASCNNASETNTNSDSVITTDPSTTTGTTTATPMDHTGATMDTASLEVPAPVRTSFEKKYANASNTRWGRYSMTDDDYKDMYPDTDLDTSDYQVNYRWNDADYTAWYDAEGNWIRTSGSIANDKLPIAINKSIEKEYAGYNVVKVDEENYKGGTKYRIKLEKGDEKVKIHVTSSGEILKLKEKS